MAKLEDILNGYERVALLQGTIHSSIKDPTNPAALNNFLVYSQKYGNVNEPLAVATLKQELAEKPARLRAQAESLLKDDQKSLIEKVSNNYKAAIQSLPEAGLKNLAFAVSGIDEGYMAIAEGLKQGNIEPARKAYVDLCPDSKLWKEFIEGDGKTIEPASTRFLAQFAQIYLRIKRDKLESELSVETEKNGKKGYELDVEKTKSYMLKKIEGIKDEGKKNSLYLTIAGAYYQSQQKDKKGADNLISLNSQAENEGAEMELAA